jgi:hypothetical protein
MNCSDYNGNKDVKFIMDITDSRTDDKNWQILDTVNVVKNQFTSKKVDYTVHSDWSVSRLA